MFSFFKKKPKVDTTDYVWMSLAAKYRNFAEQATSTVKQRELLIIFSYFEQTYQEVQKILQVVGEPFILINEEKPSNDSNLIYLLKVEDYEKDKSLLAWTDQYYPNHKLNFLFAEHYPAYEKELALLLALQTWKPEAKISFYVALDEPLMKVFGSDRVLSLMQKMGMQDNEMIQHSLVSRSIVRAQQKIQKKLNHQAETSAYSQEDWIQKNISSNL